MQNLTSLRVAVADHAPFMRRLLEEALVVRGLEVAGTADSTEAAIDVCRSMAPDALLFDLVSEQMEGAELMRGLREAGLDTPVILLAGQSRADRRRTVDALIEGALDFSERPLASDTVRVFVNELVVRIRAAHDVSIARRRAIDLSSERARHSPETSRASSSGRRDPSRQGPAAVVIVGSLGGCWSLAQLIPALPPLLGVGTVVIEQLPEGFASALADRLDRISALAVREAVGGEQLDPNSVYLAPGGRHLRIGAEAKLLLSDDDPIDGLRPRADLTVSDAAHALGERLVLVVVSGMGKDGVDGAREVKERGGRVLVEAEATAKAYGTPRAVVDARLADRIVPLDELAHAIADEAGA